MAKKMKKTKLDKLKVKIDISRCYVEPYSLDYGVVMYICRSRDQMIPIGFVWGIGVGNDKKTYGDALLDSYDVWGSYVIPWARRCGVRTLINQKILEHYDVIQTRSATGEGASFMKKMGYKISPSGAHYLKKKNLNMERKIYEGNIIRYYERGGPHRKNGPCEIHPDGNLYWRDTDQHGVINTNTLYCIGPAGSVFWFNDSFGLCRTLPWENPKCILAPFNIILHDSEIS